MRSLKRFLGAALVAGAAVAVAPAGPAAAQSPVCVPFRNGVTITLVGQDIDVPGHGLDCIYPPSVNPEVYEDGNTTVISLNRYGTRICMFGINGNCTVAVEI